MQQQLDRDAGPWWKEPWPWLLMAGPAIVIVACIATIALAVMHDDPPVSGPIVKRGLVVEQAQ